MNFDDFTSSIEVMMAAAGKGFFDFSTLEGKVILGVIAVVVLGLAAWSVTALLKPTGERTRHRKHRHRDDREEGGPRDDADEQHADDAAADESDDQGQHGEKKRRQRRRREHRPRNPTLSETGGLPPIRTEAPPGP